MTLDITVLDDEERPTVTASVSMDVHDKLITIAKKTGLALIDRIHDYFGDSHYECSEIPGLLKDLSVLSVACTGDPDLVAFLDSFKRVCETALARRRPISILAD
jgi:hypothetical protein